MVGYFDKWESIAKAVGGTDENGDESSSSDKSREAIEVLLGKDFIKEAVRYYVSGGAGSELLRGVLWQLHPYSVMEECYRASSSCGRLSSYKVGSRVSYSR